mgnify:CR=1 FL=1
MQLTYRGVSYDYTPAVVEMKDTSEVGTYRGVDMGFRVPTQPAGPQLAHELVYRGVAYRTGNAVLDAALPDTLSAAAERERDFCQITTA